MPVNEFLLMGRFEESGGLVFCLVCVKGLIHIQHQGRRQHLASAERNGGVAGIALKNPMDIGDDDDIDENVGRGRARSKSFIVEDDDDMENDDEIFIGRSRGQSFVVSADDLNGGTDDQPDEEEYACAGRTRGTSFAISSDDDPNAAGFVGRGRGTSFAVETGDGGGVSDDLIRRAANLSKISMKGSVAVGGVGFVPQPKPGGPKMPEITERTGALSNQALSALAKGLQADKSSPKMMTEEELEEMQLAREEAAKREEDKKQAQQSRPSVVTALTKETAKVTAKENRSKGIGKAGKAASVRQMFTKQGTGKKAHKKSDAEEPKADLTSSASLPEDSRSSEKAIERKGKLSASKRGRAASADKAPQEKARAKSAGSNSDKIGSSDRRVKTGLGLVTATANSSAQKQMYKIKLLMLGDSGVGKTCLMRRYADGTFSEHVLATAGVDFAVKTISAGSKQIAVQIWDTAGQERFHKITRTYYKGANGIVLVFDVTNKRSFNNVGYWMKNIQESLIEAKDLPAVILVGNKVDLPGRQVSREQASAEAAKYNISFHETSAKEGLNVTAAMNVCATNALDRKLGAGAAANFDGAEKKKGCLVS